MDGIFAQFEDTVWQYKYAGKIWVATLAGGTPSDPRVIEGHIRSKLVGSEEMVQEAIAKTMVDRNVGVEEATEIVSASKNLNGFKVDPEHGLFIEGRQLKAAIKESVGCAVAAGTIPQRQWGATGKSIHGFIAEHVVVDNDRLYLTQDGQPVFKADDVVQRFVHTWRGTGIQYEEVVYGAEFEFTILCDFDFDNTTKTDNFWRKIWLTGQNQGIGASRSQGFGRYKIVGWEPIPVGAAGARVTGGAQQAARATRGGSTRKAPAR